MFIKPGPAISILLISLIFSNNKFFIFRASSFGFFLFILPKIKLILQDKSKLNSTGGFSIITPLKLFKLSKFKLF